VADAPASLKAESSGYSDGIGRSWCVQPVDLPSINEKGRTSAHRGALGICSGVPEEIAMYLARFSYDVLPVNRQRAVDFSSARFKRRAPKTSRRAS
jgi:hypothetical protein